MNADISLEAVTSILKLMVYALGLQGLPMAYELWLQGAARSLGALHTRAVLHMRRNTADCFRTEPFPNVLRRRHALVPKQLELVRRSCNNHALGKQSTLPHPNCTIKIMCDTCFGKWDKSSGNTFACQTPTPPVIVCSEPPCSAPRNRSSAHESSIQTDY